MIMKNLLIIIACSTFWSLGAQEKSSKEIELVLDEGLDVESISIFNEFDYTKYDLSIKVFVESDIASDIFEEFEWTSNVKSLMIFGGKSINEDSNMTFFPINLNNFVNLEHLEIYDFPFIGFSSDITLDSLETLSIINSRLRHYPMEINNFEYLENLTLAHCDIESIDSNSITLSHLEKISLISIPLSQFPVDLFNMHKVTHLSINGTNIEKIPSGLVSLSELKVFSGLTLPGIYECSIEICTLPKLNEVHCSFVNDSKISHCFLDRSIWSKEGVDFYRIDDIR